MGVDIKQKIKQEIKTFVAEENLRCEMSTLVDAGIPYPAEGLWQEPLVGFADVRGEAVRNLKKSVHKDHQMPEDVIPDASVVIAYFVPFQQWLPKTNCGDGLASPQWAEAYELTNAMFGRLNEHMIDVIHKLGYEAKTAPEAVVFYKEEIISHWSFRHLAYAAGLGTFGLNNMLITEKGCGGRYNTVITNLDIEPDAPQKEEACLYRREGACGACMGKCPAQALSPEGFDRQKCYDQCMKNAAVYNTFGSSYASEPGIEPDDEGTDVCGKCMVGVPCTYKRP